MLGHHGVQTVDQLLYICFSSPHSISTCDACTLLSSSLPLNRSAALPRIAPFIDKMHYLRSMLLSALVFLLFGFDTQAAILGTRAPVNASSPSVYETRFTNVTWDNAAWEVNTTNLDQGHYQSRLSIANGYLGINVAAAGPFFEQDVPVDGDNINGWPLFGQRQTFATIAGFFDEQPTTNGTNFEWLNQYGGESVISGVPHWAGIIVDLGANVYLDATVVCTSPTLDAFIRSRLQKTQLWRTAFEPDLAYYVRSRLSHCFFTLRTERC